MEIEYLMRDVFFFLLRTSQNANISFMQIAQFYTLFVGNFPCQCVLSTYSDGTVTRYIFGSNRIKLLSELRCIGRL